MLLNIFNLLFNNLFLKSKNFVNIKISKKTMKIFFRKIDKIKINIVIISRNQSYF